jgi:hypothetical protein
MRYVCLVLSVALVASFGPPAAAGDCGCAASAGCADDPCGYCGPACRGKRCELQIGTKKVKVTCFDCECEDICLPGPSRKHCEHREDVCSECGSDCGCSCAHKGGPKFVWSEWCATKCAKITNVKRLVKREVEKEVPDYKWVVVDCCDACGATAPAAGPGEDRAPMPPVPTPASTTTKRRGISKPAPANARVGEVFPLTDAEIKQVEGQIQQASHVSPTARVAAKPVVVKSAAKAPLKSAAPAVRPVSAEVTTNNVPWSLFSN